MSAAGSKFPFSAVVGQDQARAALLLATIDPAIGGVLLRGDKGSAKTTLARGLAGLLSNDARFVELPIGATEDRVLGSLDLRAALDEGDVERFRPGLLAAAHSGVLYVDEINLLADHLVDALLDAAASGVNRVERDGVSHEHPARFVLVGSMNPEEGELRPQLLDRFGLAVEVRAPQDPELRAEAVRRRLAFDAGLPLSEDVTWSHGDDELRHRLAVAQPAGLSTEVLRFAARAAVEVGAESLRADLVLCRAAAALAGWEGRTATATEDVARVAPLVLAHRRRRRPFDPPSLPSDELSAALDVARAGRSPSDDEAEAQPDEVAQSDTGSASLDHLGSWASVLDSDGEAEDLGPELTAEPDESPSSLPEPDWDRPEDDTSDRVGDDTAELPDDYFDEEDEDEPRGGSVSELPRPGLLSRQPHDPIVPPMPAGSTAPAPRWDELAGSNLQAEPTPLPLEPVERPTPRRVTRPSQLTDHGDTSGPPVARRTEGPGRVVGDRAARTGTGPRDLAVVPTVRAAVRRQAAQPGGPRLVDEDLRENRRTQRLGRTVVIAVDASGSMGTVERVGAATGAVMGLLADAYLRRDQVALVAFRGSGASEMLPPTASVELARSRLADIETGGATPLAEGIAKALTTAQQVAARGSEPLLVLLTDGRATGDNDALDRARQAADAVAAAGVETIVLDAEDDQQPLGLAKDLAALMGGRYIHLSEISAPAVEIAIRNTL